MNVAGVLEIDEASADIEAKLIRGIAQVFAEPEQPAEESSSGDPAFVGKKPLNLKLAKNNQVSFSVKEGIVTHDGLSFGLPELLPNLQIQSHGDVGFDSTLDFQLDLEIPFDKMGDEGGLAALGSPAISVPVTGTFEEPEIGIGDRQLVRGFVRNAVLSFTDDEVDVQPWLDRLAEKGLLKDRLKRRRDESDVLDSSSVETEPRPEGKTENLAEPSNANSGSGTSVNAPAKNDGLLDRLRQRRQETRERRAEEKGTEVDAGNEEGGKPGRKFFGRRNEKESDPR